MKHCEKEPRSAGWKRIGEIQNRYGRALLFERGRFRALSTLDEMELPQSGGKVGPTWHVSVSRRGRRRPTPAELRPILRDFDMLDAEEDNHMPGRARHFFLPVDPRYRGVCDCKETEETLVEADGFRWQNATDGSRCGGCAFEEISGKPCEIHSRLVVLR